MSASQYIDRFLDPLAECLDEASVLRLVDLKVDSSAEERIRVLAEAANEGTLTADERDEYESLINVADFVAILKLKAVRRMQSNPNRG